MFYFHLIYVIHLEELVSVIWHLEIIWRQNCIWFGYDLIWDTIHTERKHLLIIGKHMVAITIPSQGIWTYYINLTIMPINLLLITCVIEILERHLLFVINILTNDINNQIEFLITIFDTITGKDINSQLERTITCQLCNLLN